MGAGDAEFDLGLPAGVGVDDGEWVLAVFELGTARRATSAAARAVVGPDGMRLLFEPRDWKRLAEYAQRGSEKARGEEGSGVQDEKSFAGDRLAFSAEAAKPPRSTSPPRAAGTLTDGMSDSTI